MEPAEASGYLRDAAAALLTKLFKSLSAPFFNKACKFSAQFRSSVPELVSRVRKIWQSRLNISKKGSLKKSRDWILTLDQEMASLDPESKHYGAKALNSDDWQLVLLCQESLRF